jgi:hypothetical protein
MMLADSSPAYKHDLDLLDLNDRLTCNDTKPSSSLPSVLCLSPPQTPPSREERYESYARLNHDLGPAFGIQQLVGSYQMYMKEQTRLYYERLFSEFGPHHVGIGKRPPAAGHRGPPSRHPSTIGDCSTNRNRGTGLANRTSRGRSGPPTKNNLDATSPAAVFSDANQQGTVAATKLGSNASGSTTAAARVASSSSTGRFSPYRDKRALSRLERASAKRPGRLVNFA